jgi:hypothetical protein
MSVGFFAGISAAIVALLGGAVALVILLRRRGNCGGSVTSYERATHEAGTESSPGSFLFGLNDTVTGYATACNPVTALGTEIQLWEPPISLVAFDE